MSEPVLVSSTRMAMLSRCGEQFRRRYVEGDIAPPGVALIVGSAVDRSVTTNLRSKIDGKGLLDLEEVADVARDECEDRWSFEEVLLTDEEAELGIAKVKGESLDKSVRLAKLHARELAPIIEPTHVQRGFSLDIADARVTGYIDIQEGTKAIRDTKTSKRSPSANAAQTSLQLGVYALATRVLDGALPERVWLDYLVDKTRPEARGGPVLRAVQAVTLSSHRDDAAIEMVLARIGRFVDTVRAGSFQPTDPDNWACSRQWCGYFGSCPFALRPVQVAFQGGE